MLKLLAIVASIVLCTGIIGSNAFAATTSAQDVRNSKSMMDQACAKYKDTQNAWNTLKNAASKAVLKKLKAELENTKSQCQGWTSNYNNAKNVYCTTSRMNNQPVDPSIGC